MATIRMTSEDEILLRALPSPCEPPAELEPQP